METPKHLYLLNGAILLILFIIFLLYASNCIMDTQVKYHSSLIGDFIYDHASRDLTQEDFVLNNISATKKKFSAFFWNIKVNDDIERIKVWDTDSKVIFSDAEEIINKTFKDNILLQEAIAGQIKYQIKKPTDPENIAEKSYDKFLEIYIPIKIKGNITSSGVIEVYYRLDRIMDFVNGVRKKLFFVMLMLFLPAIFIQAYGIKFLYRYF